MRQARAALASWRLVVAAAPLLAAACSAVPPAASARLGALDRQALAALDPHVVRLRVVLPRDYAFDPEHSLLTLTVSSAGRSRSADLAFEEVRAEAEVHRDALLEPGVPVVRSTLRLSPAARASFRELQKALGTDNDFGVNVQLAMKSAPPQATTVKVWVDLLLDPKQGYFRVVDGGTVGFERRETYRWRPQ